MTQGHIDRLSREVLYWPGLLLNVLFLALGSDPDRWLGREGKVSLGIWLYAGVYVAVGVLAARSARKARADSARKLLAVGSILSFPLHALSLAVRWNAGLAGIGLCIIQTLLVQRHTASSAGTRSWVRAARLGETVVFVNVTCAVAILLVRGYGLSAGTVALYCLPSMAAVSLVTSLLYEFFFVRGLRGQLNGSRLLAGVGLCLAFVPSFGAWALPVIAVRQLWSALLIWRDSGGGQRLWLALVKRPGWLLVSSFAGAVAIGTVVMSLPAASEGEGALPGLDALFTATSATCVTGLIVVDTASDLSRFGQYVVLALLQAGGLGIMTISTFIAMLLGRNIGLRAEFAMEEAVGERRSRKALRLVKFIAVTTLVTETLGAAALFPFFRGHGYGMWRSVELAVFHSVSAFCNAGFSLFSDSLMSVSGGWGVPSIIAALIAVGGLGFGVLHVLFLFPGRWRLQSVHTQLVLFGSLFLWIAGCALFMVFESGQGAFSGMTGGESLKHAFFQSVTSRTAGFNTVPLNELSDAGTLLTCMLMFIGAAPGSTGGGVKVTTIFVLLLAVRTALSGRRDVAFGGRTVDLESLRNAAVLTFFAAGAICLGCLLLLHTEASPGRAVVFEVFSALGTVGLSQGVTAQLTPLGKIVVTGLMFIGRIGPLTLLLLFRPRIASQIRYPSAKVMIG